MLPNDVIMYVILGIVILIVLLVIGFSIVYFILNRTVGSKLDDIVKDVKYNRKLFDDHFKTTDRTVEDTRKERDYWKDVALKNKSAKLKK